LDSPRRPARPDIVREHSLTNEDIEKLYHRHVVKPPAYFARFEYPARVFSRDELRAFESLDPPRLASLIDFREWIDAHGLRTGGSLLSTCRQDYELRYLRYDNTTFAEYPPHDLHTLDLTTKDHDFAIVSQTLEHVHDPGLAVARLATHLRTGGYLYTTVPTVNIPHMTPIHFWGITPTGLCALMVANGFEICACGYWGNRPYLEYIFSRGTWPGYRDVLEHGRLTYDPVCQAQTWVLARRIGPMDRTP
jgi:SAM-dependent methyltransferase